MDHNAKNICTTVISGKEQDLNKQMAGFENIHTFSKLDLYFSQIQYFFKDLKTDFTIEYFSKNFQFRVGTLLIGTRTR